MPVLRKRELEKRIRSLRVDMGPVKVRGWDWDSPPVRPPYDVRLGVSEVASRYCETMRDIFVRRVLGRKGVMTPHATRGVLFHETVAKAITDAKRFLFREGVTPGYKMLEELLVRSTDSVKSIMEGEVPLDLFEEAVSLYKYIVVQIASEVDRVLSKHPYIDLDSLVAMSIPPVAERVVDGSLIGLGSQLRVDLYSEGGVVVDIKTGERRDFHKLSPTGYALAIEADIEMPVDFGVIAYVRVDKWPVFRYEVFPITDELRIQFLSLRDEAMAIVANAEDPGRPERCPETCPLREVCP